jgi:hypothetical protein
MSGPGAVHAQGSGRGRRLGPEVPSPRGPRTWLNCGTPGRARGALPPPPPLPAGSAGLAAEAAAGSASRSMATTSSKCLVRRCAATRPPVGRQGMVGVAGWGLGWGRRRARAPVARARGGVLNAASARRRGRGGARPGAAQRGTAVCPRCVCGAAGGGRGAPMPVPSTTARPPARAATRTRAARAARRAASGRGRAEGVRASMASGLAGAGGAGGARGAMCLAVRVGTVLVSRARMRRSSWLGRGDRVCPIGAARACIRPGWRRLGGRHRARTPDGLPPQRRRRPPPRPAHPTPAPPPRPLNNNPGERVRGQGG